LDLGYISTGAEGGGGEDVLGGADSFLLSFSVDVQARRKSKSFSFSVDVRCFSAEGDGVLGESFEVD